MRVLFVLVVAVAAGWAGAGLLLAPPWATVFVAALVSAACCLLAWMVTSPRSQWIVPTRWRGDGAAAALALTFDDGPDPRYTPRILELLASHGARATFFVVGERAARHPELVRAIAAAGHQVGSHSWAHGPLWHFLPPAAQARDIRAGVDAIEAILGRTPLAFRTPLGLRVPHLRQTLAKVGLPLTVVTWTARGVDAVPRAPDAIVARLLPHLYAGAILTLHDGAGLGGSDDRAPTLAALARLLPAIEARGLRSVRLDELPFAAPWPAWQEARPAVATAPGT